MRSHLYSRVVDPTLRALTRADIPAWNRLLAAIELVEQSGEHYNEADLAEEMDNPDIELGKDMVGAFVDEQMVGYFSVYPRPTGGEYLKVDLEGGVHPAWRSKGIGTQLATAMMERAVAVHAERHSDLPTMYTLSGISSNLDQADLMSGIGLQPQRWAFVMRAELTDVAAPPAFPEGFVLKRYDATMAETMFEAHNAAFVDHPNFTPWSAEMWKHWVTESRNFRPQHSFVVVDKEIPAQIAAYVQTNEFDAYFEMTGKREAYVAKLGTRREYRGRGLASTLLQHCMKAYEEAGYAEAALDVDSENPTGALGIYERAGFTVESRRTDYAMVVR
jgi:mycothiol synthase